MANSPQWSVQILGHDSPVWLATGQVVTVNLHVKLVCSSNRVYGIRIPVQASYHWFNAKDEIQANVKDHRTLIQSIAFNQEFSFNAMLAAPKTPGAYRVQWEFTIGANDLELAPSANAVFGIALYVSPLPRAVNEWRIESSVNSTELAKILDGDTHSAWDSRAPQARGQWLRVDFAHRRLLDGIQMLSPGNGFPRSYALSISGDGETWQEIARTQTNNVDDVRIAFAPQVVQYAQIELLAASQTSWKIAEILAHPGFEWRVTASHNANAAYCAIDNHTESAWTSGGAQEPGMWFQLDLGREEWVNGLRLAAPQNEHPFAFRIAAWNASEGKWQVVYGLSQNFEPVDMQFERVQTQFINIQLVEPHETAWTIRAAHVHREMNDWLGANI